MEQQPRNTVISVRLDDLSLQAVDLLVQAGLAQSRSEAAAQFIGIGIRSGEELLRQARQLADNVMRIKADMMAAVKAKDVARVKALLDQDASLVNTRTPDGESSILTSVYYGAREITELLLARGAELNLFEAVALGETERVRSALGAEPELLNAYSHDGWTPIHLAAFFGHPETAELLISLGADVRLYGKNQMANTALHAALAGRRSDIARMLIEAGADPNAADAAGWVPLHHASYIGDAEIVQMLIARGAGVNHRNKKGQSPLQMAEEKSQDHVAELLRRHGAVE